MVITTETICDQLRTVYNRLDATKCNIIFQEIGDGLLLETRAIIDGICTFRMEVTPVVFDVSALGCFNESDVQHGEFNFYQIAWAMAQGNVGIDTTRGKVNRPFLKILLNDGKEFYMSYSRTAPMSFAVAKVYSSYLT